MAFKPPTQEQIAGLVGGKPLSSAFNPKTGALCVIAPSGKKCRFTPQDWVQKQNDGKKSSKTAPKSPSTKKKTPSKPKSK